jgi:recombination protein RecT
MSNNAVAIKSMHGNLEKYKAQIQAALPKHMDATRFARLALTVFSKTPKLWECSMESYLGACMQAAQVGLEPGIDAHLVPFRSKAGMGCQLIPDYKGIMKLARQTGKIGKIEAHVVRSADKFKVTYGLHSDLIHEPSMDSDDAKMIAVYAIAHYTDPNVSPDVEVMSRKEVDAIRARSKSAGDGPWVTDYEQMAIKTVIKRLCKRLPQTTELGTAIKLDNDAETETDQANILVLDPTMVEEVKEDRDPDTDEIVPPPKTTAEKLAEKAKEAK